MAVISAKDFRPVSEFATQLGCKVVLFGRPGSGKTPLAATTAPRPLLLLSEPGTLTLRGQSIPAFPAFSPERIKDFFTWFFSDSREVANYDTLIWDSASAGAEIYLDKELRKGSASGNKSHGQAAYGAMSFAMMDHLSKLYYMPRKHIIIIAHRAVVEDSGVQMARAIFPGKQLNTFVPHLFDGVFQLDKYPQFGAAPMLQCTDSFDVMARDRSGRLLQFEPPHFGNIFTKMMGM